ncbi:MAG: hypothetical protein ABI614_07230 [Planctomycetota bacterium]
MSVSTFAKPADSNLPAFRRPIDATLPPAIVFGGNDNALSIVRSLGRRSIPVYVLNEPQADVQYSRYARRLPVSTKLPFQQAAIDFLTGSESDVYAGAVLLAASDAALQSIAEHRPELEHKFRLDLSNPVAQQKMLDKLATYHIADAAGVPTPRYWQARSLTDLDACRDELVFPLIVKPVHSHLFQQKFKTKFIVVQTFEELLRAYNVVDEAQIEVLLVELIPGPDSALCSYYTYLDEVGNSLFDFTKRIIRRFPTNMGLATYHVTDHVDGVKEPALRLFRQAGLRGLANAEFKLDVRDNTLKLIECNARFTAANGLIAKAGLDLSSLVYNRLVSLPLPCLDDYRDNVTLWDPFRDFKAYRELRSRGELTMFGWLRSVTRPHMFPGFNWSDPRPGIARLRRRVFKG